MIYTNDLHQNILNSSYKANNAYDNKFILFEHGTNPYINIRHFSSRYDPNKENCYVIHSSHNAKFRQIKIYKKFVILSFDNSKFLKFDIKKNFSDFVNIESKLDVNHDLNWAIFVNFDLNKIMKITFDTEKFDKEIDYFLNLRAFI